MRTRQPQGFTLVEIMVAVAILGVIMSLIVVATLQVRIRARDSKRISDITEIMKALESYYAANRAYPTMITAGQPFLVGSTTVLPKIPSNPFPRTDGGCTNTDYIYTTTTTGYQLTTCLGAKHGRFDQGTLICKNGNCGIKDDCTGEITDSEGIRYPIVRIGEQCWMAMNLKSKKRPDNTCINNIINSEYVTDPTTCITTYSSFPGETFGGYGCYPGGCIPESRRDCIKSNPPIIPLEPGPLHGTTGWLNRGHDTVIYDYPPVSMASDCNYRGALYYWPAALNLDDNCLYNSCANMITTPFHQGICPVGWHIPTDQEFHVLESTLADPSKPCDFSRNSHMLGSDSCRDAGSNLITGGFQANLLGVRLQSTVYPGSDFQGINETTYFWTTTEGPANGYGLYLKAFVRAIDVGIPGTYRFDVEKETAASVRCIRDY